MSEGQAKDTRSKPLFFFGKSLYTDDVAGLSTPFAESSGLMPIFILVIRPQRPISCCPLRCGDVATNRRLNTSLGNFFPNRGLMKFAAYDLEIAKDLPEDGKWQDVAPLGVTCAAVAFSDDVEPIFWKGIPKMSQEECQQMVLKLQEIVNSGYTLITRNGCGFDFSVLAQESGLIKECGELALQHVDLMLVVTFTRGWYLSLQKALLGAGLKGKRKSVTLSGGTVLDDMGGIKAPKMWLDGEYNAVLSYLKDDIVELINLAKIISKVKEIRWRSNNGNLMSVPVPHFPTVIECFDIPEPDVSWMTDPPTRKQFIEWIPSTVFRKF